MIVEAIFDLGGLIAVADEFGQTWTLDRQIGQGGQGQVWLAAGGRTAVKIIGGLRGQEQARAVYAKLQRVRRLPLDGIRIAGVQALLAPPRVGYIMELAGEMFELSNLQDVPVDFEDDPGRWYLATGGFARRLRLIARLADSVARLHGRAIAYQDLSPGNVLVSSSADYDEVRLIDVDNLTVRSTVAEPAVFTPGYGAPEVVSGASGANTLADAHALAVLIFQTLTTMHPFRGDLVMDGPPQLQEEQADRYLVPWIDHPEDRSNATDRGIAPRQELLTARLWDLCRRAFVDGVADPLHRPSAAEWAAALYAATDQIIDCPACGWSFRALAAECFCCGRPPDRTWILRYMMSLGRELADDADEDSPVPPSAKLPEFTVLGTSGETRILARHAAVVPEDPEEPVAGMRFEHGTMTVHNYSRRDLWIDRGDGAGPRPIGPGSAASTRAGNLGDGWELHFGPPGSTHRWAVVNQL